MLQKVEPISITDFNKGLYTDLNILNNEKGQSPNCMNIKWNADGSIQKRLGSSTQNTLQIGSTSLAGWTLETGTQLTVGLQHYWKLNETSDDRGDEVSNLYLSPINAPASASGIRGLAASFQIVNSQSLYVVHNSSLSAGTGNFSISLWYYSGSTGTVEVIASKRSDPLSADTGFSWQLFKASDEVINLQYSSGGNLDSFSASSHGAIAANSFVHIVMWVNTLDHVGLSVNLSANTAIFGSTLYPSTAAFSIANAGTGGVNWLQGRVDEIGMWDKFITAPERAELYGGGTGNTYSRGQQGFSWAMYDFGASSIRWLTVAARTGIYASSNMGGTFIEVATTRTQNYQYFERSKNVLIATSDSYDQPMYWAGSVGTFFVSLAPNSAPLAKYSINNQGFLILLNSSTRKRGFYYQDDNTQITSAWPNNFDLPSSADD